MGLTFPQLVFRWQTSAGLPAVGYRVYFYEANDAFDTLKPVYADFELTVPLDSPVVLNAEGYAAVYAGEGTYQVRILMPEGDDTVVYSSGTIQGSASTQDTVVVATVDAMRDLVAGSASIVICANYSDSENPDGAGDGGGGVFNYDPACTLDDDGTIVFAPTSAPAEGRYIRQFSGPVDVRFGGQVGNGQSQTSPSLQGIFDAAVAYAQSMQESGDVQADVYFPPGNYLIEEDETWDQSVRLIFSQGAKLSIAAGKTLTIQCPFTKGRDTLFNYSSPTYTGTVDLSDSPIEEVFPDWFGFDTLAFERMCASGFVCPASLDALADYGIEQSATISFPGSGIKGNGSIFTLAEDISITFAQSDAFVRDLRVAGNGFSLTLTGTNGHISGLNAAGMGALVNSGGVNFDFDSLVLQGFKTDAEGVAAGTSAGRIMGGNVSILGSEVINTSGIKYGWSFEGAAVVTLVGPIIDTFDTAEYITAGGAVYSAYGNSAAVNGSVSAGTFLKAQAGAGGLYYKAGGVIDASTATVGNVGSGEDDLYVLSIPANTLNVNKDKLEFEMHGLFANNANVKRLRLRFGGTLFFDSGASYGPQNEQWRIVGSLYRASATLAHCVVVLTSGTIATVTDIDMVQRAEIAVAMNSGSKDLKLTAEATADDDVQTKGATVKFFPTP